MTYRNVATLHGTGVITSCDTFKAAGRGIMT